MSYQPNRWAIGLVPLAVLWVLGTTGAQRDVEAQIKGAVLGDIGDDVDSPDVVVAGRDVTLRGQAYSPARRQTALDKALDAPGVRSVNSELDMIPAVSPYVWGIVRDGAQVTTSGSTPDASVKAAIAAAAKSVGANDVVDRSAYGRGASDELPAAATYAAQVLSHFTRGSAVFTDGSLEVSGTARDGAAYDAALALLKTPPEGLKLSSVEVTPPVASPFVFTATSGSGAVALAGGALSAAEKQALAALAAKLFPGAKVDDKVALQSGAPSGETAAAQWALAALSHLASGRAELRDTAVTLSGQAKSPGDIEDVNALAAKAPAGFKVDAGAIAPPTVATYAFAAMRDKGGLHFTGFTPSAAAHRALLDAARGAKLPIEDNTRIAAGLPKGVDFAAVTKLALTELAGLAEGKIMLAGDKLSVQGRTPDWKIGVEAQNRVKTPPAGLTLADVNIERPQTPDEIAAEQAEKTRIAEAEAAAKAEEARKAEEAARRKRREGRRGAQGGRGRQGRRGAQGGGGGQG